jgi:hypothetical protein
LPDRDPLERDLAADATLDVEQRVEALYGVERDRIDQTLFIGAPKNGSHLLHLQLAKRDRLNRRH